jgi:hypothetical protein
MARRGGGRYISPQIDALNTLNRFAAGISNAMAMQQNFETQQARTKEMERRTNIAETEAQWRVQERNRILFREDQTRKAIGEMAGYIGELKGDQRNRGEAQALVMTKLFEVNRNYAESDIGALTQFSSVAADWMFPKVEHDYTTTDLVNKETGDTETWLFDKESGKIVGDEPLGVSKQAGTAGMSGQDLHAAALDIEKRYWTAYKDALKVRWDTMKATMGSVVLTDMSLNAEERLAKMNAMYANVRLQVLKEVGTMQDYMTKHLAPLYGKDGEAKARRLAEYWAPAEVIEPGFTKDDYKAEFNAVIGQWGWNKQSRMQLDGVIQQLGDGDRAMASQAMAEIYGDQGNIDSGEGILGFWDRQLSEVDKWGQRVMGMEPQIQVTDSMAKKQPVERFEGQLNEIFNVPVAQMDPRGMAGGTGRHDLVKPRPTQEWFDIRESLRDSIPGIFAAAQKRKMRQEAEALQERQEK